jgi:hypothetical protein
MTSCADSEVRLEHSLTVRVEWKRVEVRICEDRVWLRFAVLIGIERSGCVRRGGLLAEHGEVTGDEVELCGAQRVARKYHGQEH